MRKQPAKKSKAKTKPAKAKAAKAKAAKTKAKAKTKAAKTKAKAKAAKAKAKTKTAKTKAKATTAKAKAKTTAAKTKAKAAKTKAKTKTAKTKAKTKTAKAKAKTTTAKAKAKTKTAKTKAQAKKTKAKTKTAKAQAKTKTAKAQAKKTKAKTKTAKAKAKKKVAKAQAKTKTAKAQAKKTKAKTKTAKAKTKAKTAKAKAKAKTAEAAQASGAGPTPKQTRVLFVPEEPARVTPAFDPGPALPAWEQAGRSVRRDGVVQIRLDPPLEVLWEADLPSEGHTEPVVSRDGVLYVADRDGGLYAFDADTGEPRDEPLRTDPIREASPAWPLVEAGHVPADAVPVSAPPTLCGALLLFGDDEGVFYCVRRGAGEVLWRKLSSLELSARSGPAYQAPLSARGDVFVACADGHVYGADARSGRAHYRIFLRGAPTAPVALGSGRLLIATRPLFKGEAPRLHALRPESGERLWHRDLAGEARCLAIAKDDVIAGGPAGLSAYDVRSGSLRWSLSPERLGGPLRGGLALERWRGYAAREDGVVAFDVASGELAWSTPSGLEGALGGVSFAGGVVWAAAGRKLLAFDAEEGRLLGEHALPSAAVGAPIPAWGNLYVTTERGGVQALAPEPY